MAEKIDITNSANNIAREVVRNVYGKQLEALAETMGRFQIAERCYTILGDRDESACMDYEDGIWKIYFSERGQKSGVKTTREIEEACEFLIQEVGEDASERQQMVECFQFMESV